MFIALNDDNSKIRLLLKLYHLKAGRGVSCPITRILSKLQICFILLFKKDYDIKLTPTVL